MYPVARYEQWPLTSLQRSMVLASKRSPGAGLYIIQDICESPERFDIDVLERAWLELARRHAILRSRIETRGEVLTQQPVERANIGFRRVDWTSATPAEFNHQFASFLREDGERGFDLEAEIPARFTLLRTGSGSTLVWTVHHAILDARSLVLAWRELFALYDSFKGGSAAVLPEPEPFYKHTEWLAANHDTVRAEQYWREQFRDVRNTTDYVVDRLRTAATSAPHAVTKESVRLSQEFTTALDAFARRHEISTGTVVQGAWTLLLSRYSGRQDVVFGLTRAGRYSIPRADEIIGPLINTIPVRTTVEGSASAVSMLQRIRKQSIEAREYEHTPVDKIWEWSGLPSGMPPFESVLVYQHETPEETFHKLGGAWKNRRITRVQRTDTPLTLAAYGAPVLTLDVIYNKSLFTPATMAALTGHLQILLEELVSKPQAAISSLQMLTAEERRQIIGGAHSVTLEIPRELCAQQLFEHQVLRTPDAVALDGPHGPVSYDQLNRRANRIAHHLRGLGAGPEDFVAVCLDASPDAIMATLAILKAGAAFVPMHPGLPTERLAAMLDDARPKVIVTESRHLANLGPRQQPVLTLDRLGLDDEAEDNLPSAAAPDNVAYAIYTSGSTGVPKAAVVTHRSLVNHTLAASRVFEISASDRRLQFATLAADLFVAEVFNYLSNGATLVSGLNLHGVSVAEFLRRIEAHRITITGIPSSWWKEWASAVLPPSLRAVIIGMERVDAAAVLAWKRRAGKTIRLFNAYGPTETCPTTTIYEVGSSRWESASFVPIGKPIANTYTYVLDGAMNPLPAGVPGELYIGGAGVGRGYWNAPGLTAAQFCDDPCRPGNRLFRTGDVAFRLPDDNLVFVGRADRQVKIRGFRVELDEIEALLARHPAVRQCAVVLRESDPGPALVAYAASARSAPLESNELRQHLARYLPEHMVPAAFVILPALPLTASGKIDRHSLPAWQPGQLDPAAISDPPSTPTEIRLSRLWQEVLPRAPLSASQNFFAAGGDSLSAVRLLLRIGEEFGRDLPFAALLRAPTLAQISRVIDESEGEYYDVMRVNPGGGRPTLYCITASGEDLFVFRHIAAHIDEEQPLTVLSNPIVEGAPGQTVEKLANIVCRNVRALQPQGPYVLGGYCFGGILAFEAAQQLIAEGERVELVLLIDTPAPGYPKIMNSRERYWLQLRQVFAGAFNSRELLKHTGVIARMAGRRAAAHVQRLLIRSGFGRFASHPNDKSRLIEISARMYVPRKLASDVAQIMAADDVISARVLEDPRLGWGDLSRHFEVLRVGGSHGTLLTAPHAPAIARTFSEVLKRYSRPR